MAEIEEGHVNNMSLQSSSRSKLNEFTFCNVLDFNGNEKSCIDEHPFAFSPSFGPKASYFGYNYLSPSTKARKKVLEMMNNLPKSYQELSLKDIVIDDHGKERSTVDQKRDLKSGLKARKSIKRESTISRSVSLDTGDFMLKMFNPISCGMKKCRSSSKIFSNNNSLSNDNNKGSSHKSNSRCRPPNTKSRSRELEPGCWFTNKPWKPTSRRSV